MPRVLEDPNALAAHMALCPTCDEHETLPSALPSYQQERSPVLAWLGRLFTPLPRPRPRRQGDCALGTRRFETPLDVLAREYPDLHLWVISSIG
jgi:hypothetical protein